MGSTAVVVLPFGLNAVAREEGRRRLRSHGERDARQRIPRARVVKKQTTVKVFFYILLSPTGQPLGSDRRGGSARTPQRCQVQGAGERGILPLA